MRQIILFISIFPDGDGIKLLFYWAVLGIVYKCCQVLKKFNVNNFVTLNHPFQIIREQRYLIIVVGLVT